ncbi:repressor [Eikenella longinqua]|uniref:Repressor n=1 Tax=Eikenella longinqua TaxID=1795827 RepID=A0A1A9S2K9_9NEIS|nr:helix-turn-helix transcriptional regulator [Eikenella longinqua]OAM31528.1 repressor [Eikenella longinqua]
MENFNVEFAKRMEIVAKRLGSISELARRVDVAYPTATKWVKEGAEPSTTNLIKIADAAQVNLLWLATGQGSPSLEGEQKISGGLEQEEGQRILQEQLDKTNQIVKGLKEARRISRMGGTHPLNVNGDVVDIDEFVFIPFYDVSVSAGQGAWVDNDRPKSCLTFRRDWLESYITSDFSTLTVVMVKGDSMVGVLNDKDAILVDHSQTEASDGLYALRIGNETFVKRVQRLPDSLLITSANQEYQPFTVPLENGDATSSSVSIIGKVVWLGRAL